MENDDDNPMKRLVNRFVDMDFGDWIVFILETAVVLMLVKTLIFEW